jgi:hypothetical protein
MKKIIITICTLFLLLVSPVFISNTLADTPPDPGGDPNTGGGTPVGGSPIGGGLTILIAMGAAYGMKKVYQFNNSESRD